MTTNRKWGIEELEARKHHKGVLAMLTLDLMPFSFVSNPGFLYYSAIGSPRYDVCSETFYRGLVEKVKLLLGKPFLKYVYMYFSICLKMTLTLIIVCCLLKWYFW